MKKRDNILTHADICNAREALHKPPKADVIYLTPGEFKSIYAAFERMENEIKKLHGLVIERDTLVKINQQLHDNLEALRNDNLQLIEQIALKHDNVKMEEEQHCE